MSSSVDSVQALGAAPGDGNSLITPTPGPFAVSNRKIASITSCPATTAQRGASNSASTSKPAAAASRARRHNSSASLPAPLKVAISKEMPHRFRQWLSGTNSATSAAASPPRQRPAEIGDPGFCLGFGRGPDFFQHARSLPPLRRTCACVWSKASPSPPARQTIEGWASGKISRRWTAQPSAQCLQAAVDRSCRKNVKPAHATRFDVRRYRGMTDEERQLLENTARSLLRVIDQQKDTVIGMEAALLEIFPRPIYFRSPQARNPGATEAEPEGPGSRRQGRKLPARISPEARTVEAVSGC